MSEEVNSDGCTGCLGVLVAIVVSVGVLTWAAVKVDGCATEMRAPAVAAQQEKDRAFALETARKKASKDAKTGVEAYERLLPLDTVHQQHYVTALLRAASSADDTTTALSYYRKAIATGLVDADRRAKAARMEFAQAKALFEDAESDTNPVTRGRTLDVVGSHLDHAGNAGVPPGDLATARADLARAKEDVRCAGMGPVRDRWIRREFQEVLYNLRLDIETGSAGKCKDVAVLRYPLWTGLEVHEFRKGALGNELRKKGFRQAKFVSIDRTWTESL